MSDADDCNPVLLGYACAILLERGLIANDDLGREDGGFRPGVPADLGAGWFEGLSKRNRYALLARRPLWARLADYIASPDEEHFRRSVVFLRRAFGGFSAREKRQIAENLGEHWCVSADAAAEAIESKLSETEEKTLKDLNEFNFDDLSSPRECTPERLPELIAGVLGGGDLKALASKVESRESSR